MASLGVAVREYPTSTFKYVSIDYRIRFAYEATGQLTRFTDYDDEKYLSRTVFSFHRQETIKALLNKSDTIRNNMKHFPVFDTTGFRKCQIIAIENLDTSFADNRPSVNFSPIRLMTITGHFHSFTACAV